MENKLVKIATSTVFDLSVSAINTAVCSFVARKINYFIDRQEQAKIVAQEHNPAPKEKRIGFFNEKKLTILQAIEVTRKLVASNTNEKFIISALENDGFNISKIKTIILWAKNSI